jgi:hypothetical protein
MASAQREISMREASAKAVFCKRHRGDYLKTRALPWNDDR